jgi:Ras-related protein Rab-7A
VLPTPSPSIASNIAEALPSNGAARGSNGSVAKAFVEEAADVEEEQTTAKVVIAGACSSGKTSILARFVGDDRDQDYEPTVGADLRIVEVPVRERMLTLHIWDTAGDPKMAGTGRQIYRDSDCLVLVYDITSRGSFEALETHWENYLGYAQPDEPDEFPAVLVGNKSDLSDRRAVPLEEVMEWCAYKRPRKPITYIGR